MTDLTDRPTTPVAPAHVQVAEQLVAETSDMMAVAAWLEEHGDNLPRPYLTASYITGTGYVRCLTFSAQTREAFASAERAMAAGAPKGAVQKLPSDSGNYMVATRMLGAVQIEVRTARENVCERRQVGVQEVEVPDPSAEVPMVTEQQPVYEWVCEPTLAPTDAEVSS